MSVSRRRVLQVGLGGTVLLALGGVGLALRPTTVRTPSSPLKVLTVAEYSIVLSVAERIVRPDSEMPSVLELGVAEEIDAMLLGVPTLDVTQIKQVLALLENAFASLVLSGRLTTFTGSSPEAQSRILDGWRTSSLNTKRQAYRVLHSLCVAAYWGNPRAYAATGYPGPPDFSAVPSPAAPVEPGEEEGQDLPALEGASP